MPFGILETLAAIVIVLSVIKLVVLLISQKKFIPNRKYHLL